MNQTSFLPVKIAHEEPYMGTADLRLVGYTASRQRYAIKRRSDGTLLPLAEWLGYNLCRLSGIGTPEFAVVECLSGELAFGSRWEEPAFQITHSTPPNQTLLMLSSHRRDVSSIHGLDRVYANPDRHAGNYLFVTRAGAQMALAMDFSRAGPMNGGEPFGAVPLPSDCPTMVIAQILADRGLADARSYRETLARVAGVQTADLSRALDAAPDDWFDTIGKAAILDWWDNSMSERVAQART